MCLKKKKLECVTNYTITYKDMKLTLKKEFGNLVASADDNIPSTKNKLVFLGEHKTTL